MTVTRPRSPARHALVTVSCLIAAGFLSGCASVFGGSSGGGASDDAGPTSYDHASGAQDALLSIDVTGGFLPIGASLRDTADLLLLGDGTLIAAGPTIQIYPGPALNPLQSSQLSEAQIQQLFTQADDAGLLDGDLDFGEPPIADAPTTVVSITVDGRTVTHSAYALGDQRNPDPSLSDAAQAARESLTGFVDAAQTLEGSDAQGYEPSGVVAYRINAEQANPPEQPDGAPEPMAWPIAAAPEPPTAESGLVSCLVVTGTDAQTLIAALAQATEVTPWIIGDQPPAQMAFRPYLPGDPGCE